MLWVEGYCLCLEQGLGSYGMCAHNDMWKYFLGMWHSLQSQLFLFFFAD